jgi:CRP-like cAMP-binding protein
MNPGDSNIRVYTYLALKRSGISIGTPARRVRLAARRGQQGGQTTKEISQRAMALRKVDIFSSFDEEALQKLARRLRTAPYLPGDTLVRQGADANSLYVIVEGRAKVYVANENGERAEVAELGPGNFFGEMGLMTGEPRTATVVAKTAMKTYRLDKDLFRDLLMEHPDIEEHISEVLAMRRAELDATLEELDEEMMKERTDINRTAIRQRIRQFFGIAG